MFCMRLTSFPFSKKLSHNTTLNQFYFISLETFICNFPNSLHYSMSQTTLSTPLSSKMIDHSFCIDLGIGSRSSGSIVPPPHRTHIVPSGKTSSQKTTMMTFLLKMRKSNNKSLLAAYNMRARMHLTKISVAAIFLGLGESLRASLSTFFLINIQLSKEDSRR